MSGKKGRTVKSTEDYEQWKANVRNKYILKYPNKEKYVNEFMDYVSKVYDPLGRAYFPAKLMWYLFEKRRKVIKNNQHYWMAFIGKKGGEGKSTLAKQVLHFLDPTFHCARIGMTHHEFVKAAYKAKQEERIDYPSVQLDEPENKTHQMSARGRKLRDILEKIRQMNLFVGVCANSLQSVPTPIYDRLTTICFLSSKHKFILWDIDKDKESIVIDEIKEKFGKVKHKCFMSKGIIDKAHFRNMKFSKECPFDDDLYLKRKEQDLLADMGDYLEAEEKKASRKPKP